MTHQIQILVVPQRDRIPLVGGFRCLHCVDEPSLQSVRSSTLPSTTHASPDWPNAIAQPIDESCDCRPVRFRDITITPAPPGMDLRHATTPLLGEATNPIDAAIAAAIAATPARLGNRRAELQRAADAVPWLCRNGGGEPS